MDAHRAGVQHDLSALLQQNTERRAKQEYWNIGGIRPRFQFKDDAIAVAEQETRDIRNTQQESFAVDLPGWSRRIGMLERGGHLAAADGDIGRAANGLRRVASRQGDLAGYR